METIVTPGEIISENASKVSNAFIQNGRTYSNVLGIYKSDSNEIIPLEGAWEPRVDDSVVGIVTEVKPKVYIVDVSYFGNGLIIPGKYENYEFKIGDVVNAVINDIEGKKTIILKDPQQLKGGNVINIRPKKIPRVIGKKSTMIKQIADSTGTHIVVGMNGMIWINGVNAPLATKALLKIENEAHVKGLTDVIKRFLEEAK
ncbi:MAG: KH domain-containing protein [Candidatus Micrarchaeaceae archaeon]